MKTKTQALPALNESCDICRSPQRLALLSMKELGATTAELAEAGNFTPAMIELHFATHVNVQSGTDDPNVDQALTDAQELFFTATLSGNLNAAASALSVRGRLLNDMRRRKESTAKRKNLIENADPCDPHTWPAELAEFIQAVQDDIVRRVVDFEATT